MTRPSNWEVLEVHQAKNYVFLSHASEDDDLVRFVRGKLESQGLVVWDDSEIQAGSGWRSTISEKLAKSAAAVTLWTPASVKSDSVAEETTNAMAQNKAVSVRFGSATLPLVFAETQYYSMPKDASKAPPSAWIKLAEAVKDKIDPTRVTSSNRFVDSAPVTAEIENDKVVVRAVSSDQEPLINDPAAKKNQLKTHAHFLGEVEIGLKSSAAKNSIPEDFAGVLASYRRAFETDLWEVHYRGYFIFKKAAEGMGCSNFHLSVEGPLGQLLDHFGTLKNYYSPMVQDVAPEIEPLAGREDDVRQVRDLLKDLTQAPEIQQALSPKAFELLQSEQADLEASSEFDEFDLPMASRQRVAAGEALRSLTQLFAVIRKALDPTDSVGLAEIVIQTREAKSKVGEAMLDGQIEAYVKGQQALADAPETIVAQAKLLMKEAPAAARTAALQILFSSSTLLLTRLLSFF